MAHRGTPQLERLEIRGEYNRKIPVPSCVQMRGYDKIHQTVTRLGYAAISHATNDFE